MKFPETKLEFLDITAKAVVDSEALCDLISEEPYLLLPFAVYSSELADRFYPEEEDGRVKTSERILAHTIDDTRFELYKRHELDKGLRYVVRVLKAPSNTVVHSITLKSVGDAIAHIMDYITNNM